MYGIINNITDDEMAADETLKKSLVYDFENNCFLMADGSPVLSEDENTLINQWLEWLIRTEPAKYSMFSANFGVDTDSIIGGKITKKALQIGMIEDSIRANLDKCPVISDITNFQAVQEIDKLKIYFEVITTSGSRKGVDLAV